MQYMHRTFEVSKLLTSSASTFEQFANMASMSVVMEVSNVPTSMALAFVKPLNM